MDAFHEAALVNRAFICQCKIILENVESDLESNQLTNTWGGDDFVAWQLRKLILVAIDNELSYAPAEAFVRVNFLLHQSFRCQISLSAEEQRWACGS